MGIITKEVEVKPSGKSIKYYQNLGYNIKWHEPIMVRVEDLSRTTKIKIEVQCDYCKTIKWISYATFFKSINNDGKYACNSCSYHKMSKTVYERYGVNNYAQTEEYTKKIKETSLEKYGTISPNQSEEVKLKIRNSVLNKYGVECVLSAPEIIEKRNETNLRKYGSYCPINNDEIFKKSQETLLKRYGCTNASQSPIVREKIVQSFIKHYGVDHPSKSPEIRGKAAQTLYKNGIQNTSKQQLYIYNLYKSINPKIQLNYPISRFNADICFLEEKIDIEVDCGGHNLGVKMGNMTQEEFEHKELIRNNIIKREGYKQIRIISRKDLLPSDQVLILMLSMAIEYFNATIHTWVNFDIDNSRIINAENKDNNGTFFDYGELRRIKIE